MVHPVREGLPLPAASDFSAQGIDLACEHLELLAHFLDHVA